MDLLPVLFGLLGALQVMSYSCLTPGGTEAEKAATAEVAVCAQTPGNFSRWDEQWWVMALRACLNQVVWSCLIMFEHHNFFASKRHFSGNSHWCQIRICRCSSNFRRPVSRGFRAGNQEDLIQKLQFMGWAYVNMMINQHQQLDFWMPDFWTKLWMLHSFPRLATTLLLPQLLHSKVGI